MRVRREEHKRVWASPIEDQAEVIKTAAQEMKRCDPDGTKRHVAVCDGERGLQCKLAKMLPGGVEGRGRARCPFRKSAARGSQLNSPEFSLCSH